MSGATDAIWRKATTLSFRVRAQPASPSHPAPALDTDRDSLSVPPPSPDNEYERIVVCEVERHCRELFLRRHGVGLALPCTVLGQRRGELLEKLVRQGVFGGLGRDDAVGRDDVGVVGQLLGH